MSCRRMADVRVDLGGRYGTLVLSLQPVVGNADGQIANRRWLEHTGIVDDDKGHRSVADVMQMCLRRQLLENVPPLRLVPSFIRQYIFGEYATVGTDSAIGKRLLFKKPH